jgi:DHA1 family multidrug resistance protein-like MFS transporter
MKGRTYQMGAYFKELLQMSVGVRRFITTEILLGISIGLFTLVSNLHLLALGLQEETIGTISSVGALVMGLAGIPAGLVSNYWGRKNMLVSGIALMGFSYAIFGAGTMVWVFYAAQIIQSIGITLLITSEIQLLFRYSQSKKEETAAFSLLFAIFTLFTGGGTLLGGMLPRWIGGFTSVYQSSLFIAAAIMILGALLRAIWLPKEPPITSESEFPSSDKPPSALLASSHANASIWILSVFVLISGFTFGWIGNFLNIIVKFRLGWSDEWVSLALTLNGVFLFAGSLLMPYLLGRWGMTKGFMAIFCFNAASAFLLALTLPSFLFISILLVRSGLFTLLNNMIDSQSMSAIAEQKRDIFAGVRSVFRSLGLAASTYGTGVILQHKNYILPFFYTGCVLVISGIYFWFWVRPLLEERGKRTRESGVLSSD